MFNLTILFAEVDHGGDYVCSAANKAGETMATVQVSFQTNFYKITKDNLYVNNNL